MGPNSHLKTSQNGLEHIVKWEGLKLTRYICPAGKPTIGVGHVILPNENYQTITREQAFEILAKDVERFESAIKKHVTVPLNQNQFDALVSFIFNTGEGGIINTGVQKAVNSREFDKVPEKLEEWSKFRVNGELKVNRGLLNRRKSESQLFLKPIDSFPKEPIKLVLWTKPLLLEAQDKLKKLGLYTTKVDGIWGPNTEKAVLNFAKNNQINVSGFNLKSEIPEELIEALKKSN
jgi:lysozyme